MFCGAIKYAQKMPFLALFSQRWDKKRLKVIVTFLEDLSESEKNEHKAG